MVDLKPPSLEQAASAHVEHELNTAEIGCAAIKAESDIEARYDQDGQAISQVPTNLTSRSPLATDSRLEFANNTPEMQEMAAAKNDMQSCDPAAPESTGELKVTPTISATSGENSRLRTESESTNATSVITNQNASHTSLAFVTSALETISDSKDARKRKDLAHAVKRAGDSIHNAHGDFSTIDPEIIFEPLRLASESMTISTVSTALDCLGKLISHSFFTNGHGSASFQQSLRDQDESTTKPALIERAIDAICDCFHGESTANEIQLQVIRSLLAAILNDTVIVHGAGLLKSIRQTYNIFLLSRSSGNQQIAQGALTQMMNTVFERVTRRLRQKADSPSPQDARNVDGAADLENGGADVSFADVGQVVSTPERDSQPMTLQYFETRKSFDDGKITDSAQFTKAREFRTIRTESTEIMSDSGVPTTSLSPYDRRTDLNEEDEELLIRDAFLVFRAMCKLSTKALRPEEALDAKSQGVRSKLLSLHLIHTLLLNHTLVFTSVSAIIRGSSESDASTFTQAIKQYICLTLSRNGASNNHKVFEISTEIFWLMNEHLRHQLKRELEVFYKEIYLAIMEKRAAPIWQKLCIVKRIFGRVAADPQLLVELYLNYDCDNLENIYQRVVEHMQRVSCLAVQVTPGQQQAYSSFDTRDSGAGTVDVRGRDVLPPSLATTSMTSISDTEQAFPAEYALKMQALDALVTTLRSMIAWAEKHGTISSQNTDNEGSGQDKEGSGHETRTSSDLQIEQKVSIISSSPRPGLPADATLNNASFTLPDDPDALQQMKERKMALNSAVSQFNFKPKRGIRRLIDNGFVSSDPDDIARFLLDNNQIDKKALGEYLGEGEEVNIKIMHAFVDRMEFSRMRFVDALRRFLQSFRLPGEAQKIDRLMLKFAERYTSGNPTAFANADTAYVLAYSVIMLNTDQHSAQVKKRMTVEDFIKNNRGINDNTNLPNEYLQSIFDEIVRNEIVLDTEREKEANLAASSQLPGGGIINAIANAGRDLQREAYAQASDKMSTRTEQLFKSMLRAQRKNGTIARSQFLIASSSRHIGPMFSLAWMSFLTALSGVVQETQNIEAVRLCMEGEKLAIHITCLFDLEDPRQAFISSLSRHTNLYNLSEMKAKHVEALKALLEIAFAEGNHLKESWREVLTCISQLDRFQLISSGIEEGVIPDVLRGPPEAANGTLDRRSMHRTSTTGPYQAEIAEESRSAAMVRVVDRIFTSTAALSGDAIIHFVRALTQVSWQEIQSSGQSDSPRTYSLQKLVEISGYNMSRVRFEWTSIWQILGQHFIDVGCHHNTHVVYFALNSLRQLSMRFLEIEELAGFRFQKDFLKPFEFILSNASQVLVKDMVLRCLIQMIQARGDMIKSGWRTMFGVFTVAAREPYESIVNLAFDNVTQIYNTRFGVVISQGAFADFVICLTEFSKNSRFQKKSLQAIEALKSTVPKMLCTPECSLSKRVVDSGEVSQLGNLTGPPLEATREERFWFPVLFAFHDVLMTGEDLEVRSRALNYLFDTLTRFGGEFPHGFWDTLWRQLLYPIFMVLKDPKAVNHDAINQEELSVWLSTTLIQALRNMISLFTHFFTSLEYMLDRFLDLLALCICQDNDTLARIGSNCLQQLILQNVTKFTPQHWEQIVAAFINLFARTEARELFSTVPSRAQRNVLDANDEVKGGYDAQKPSNMYERSEPSNIAKHRQSVEVIKTYPATSEEPLQNRNDAVYSTHAALQMAFDDGVNGTQQGSETFRQSSETGEFAELQSKQSSMPAVTAERRRYFNRIITKCVLQLLMIETVSELFNNDAVYTSIPSKLLLKLMALLKKSFHFAKRFNEDRELRTRLFREGFMKQPPNLLKQESGSASVYILILMRMHTDKVPERITSHGDTEAALIPLCQDILASYILLDEETQQRNIATWRPVVIDILDGYLRFDESDFQKHVVKFAALGVELMNREMGQDLRRSVQALWRRVNMVNLGIECMPDVDTTASTSLRSSPSARRRGDSSA